MAVGFLRNNFIAHKAKDCHFFMSILIMYS